LLYSALTGLQRAFGSTTQGVGQARGRSLGLALGYQIAPFQGVEYLTDLFNSDA
jgi:hypothetical protein